MRCEVGTDNLAVPFGIEDDDCRPCAEGSDSLAKDELPCVETSEEDAALRARRQQ